MGNMVILIDGNSCEDRVLKPKIISHNSSKISKINLLYSKLPEASDLKLFPPRVLEIYFVLIQ